jgi:serine/threonine-protein kinase
MAIGQTFVGNYRMYHLIRAGSVYEIWTVRPMSETKPYALKWLPPGPKYTREALNELKHEYLVGSGLDHPSIIKTYEFQTTNNGAYLLLELFKVLNMKQRIIANHRKLHPFMQSILINSAAGLAVMHDQGWIHRDVKPDNFLLGEEGEVKLIDFNLARKRPGALVKALGMKTKVQGTHSYMAPEQIRGQRVDAAADIYSLGCVVHELLSGKPPFTANTPAELLQRHLRAKPPSLTVVDKNITPEFAAFVQRMMAKDPAERPATMKEVQMDFRAHKIFYNPPQVVEGEEEKPIRLGDDEE